MFTFSCLPVASPAALDITATVALNADHLGAGTVSARQLLWRLDPAPEDGDIACDVVVMADWYVGPLHHTRSNANPYLPPWSFAFCASSFFLVEAHAALLAVLKRALAGSQAGRVVSLAPPRGGSLDKFVAAARSAGWTVTVADAYDDAWHAQHRAALAAPRQPGAPAYDPDTHYPLLVTMCVA